MSELLHGDEQVGVEALQQEDGDYEDDDEALAEHASEGLKLNIVTK